jgi:Bacterial sugar transferase
MGSPRPLPTLSAHGRLRPGTRVGSSRSSLRPEDSRLRVGPVRQATTPAQRTSLEHLPLDGRQAGAAVPSVLADGGSGRRVVAGDRLYCSTKRVTDVALVLAFAPLWIALYLLVVLSILLVDGRPVHYRDRRVGLGGRPLRLLKFRSMRTGADAELTVLLDRDPAAFEEFARYKKLRQDPRVTRLGRMIRRFSIDELPQLVHVLIGDLSLVGPDRSRNRRSPRRTGNGGRNCFPYVRA